MEKRRLTVEEIEAWCERYKSTPLNQIPLQVVIDEQPSLMIVLKSAVLNLRDQEAAIAELRDQVCYLRTRVD